MLSLPCLLSRQVHLCLNPRISTFPIPSRSIALGKARGLSSKANKLDPRTKVGKQRLDQICFEQHPDVGRNVLTSWIVQGKVAVNKRVVYKAGTLIPADALIEINAKLERYVCRAGKKLEAALDHFNVDVRNLSALDAGISTGGFTDCLLQRGVSSVVGVDVGYGQVAERVRVDKRVTVLERTNLRHLRLEDLPNSKPVEFVTLDLSFISLLTVISQVCTLMAPKAGLVTLIKPQFEAAKHQVQKGGIVDDPAVHEEVLQRVTEGIIDKGFACRGVIESPIAGAVSSNKEFLAYFERNQPNTSSEAHGGVV